MRYTLSPQRLRVFTVMLLHVCMIIAAMKICVPAIAQNDQRDEAKKQFYAQLRNGVGQEVKFALAGASLEDTRRSVESLSSFIQVRSSAELSGQLKTRLAKLEQCTLNDQSNRLSIDDLTDVLALTAQNILNTLDEQEIHYAAEMLRDGGDYGNYVILRANGAGRQRASDFENRVKALRSQSRQNGQVNSKVRSIVRNEVADRVHFLGEALPEQFGNVQKIGITPVQAILIAYSIASDDLLLFSRDALQKQLELTHEQLATLGDTSPRKSEKAYGVKGERFSTPLDLAFNPSSLDKLLDRLESKSAK